MVEGEAGDWRSGEAEDRAILLASGLGLIVYAGIFTGDWKEFYQYFRQSRFIHAMSIDFVLLSAFAPFWVFNDMTTRKWYNKGSWLLPVSVVPFLGPALYLLLRPPVPAVQASSSLSSLEEEYCVNPLFVMLNLDTPHIM
nr:Taste receptor type 1 member 1 like [Ipomoea batatas]